MEVTEPRGRNPRQAGLGRGQHALLETFYRSRTVYPSEVASQHAEFRRWDLLEVWIEEAGARIDVHLWLHVFRFDEYPREPC